MNTFWVTFYSYKGGVGRTMALANVAAMLAKEGRRVLLIDFDLEAPGLDAFEGLGCAKGHSGVVEYVAEYLATGKAPPIGSFVRECVPSSTHLRGKLWLMPSGKKDQQYNRDRARINWTELYDKFDGERFIENWKADIEKTYRPDYVLIDSRTGLTDVGGICTLHLPQLVVLLYALNDQNIHGIAGVARAISKAENTRPPQLLTVATPVPPMPKERTGLLQERLELAERELGVKPHCQIHYDARVPLKEEIFVWELSGSFLSKEYRTLKDKLTDYDVRGLDFLIKESKRAVEELDEERALTSQGDLERDYSDRAESFYQIANASRAFGRLEQVEPNLRKSIALDPYFLPAFDELIAFLKVKKRLKEAIVLCHDRLRALGDDAKREESDSTAFLLGEISMAAKDYATAVEAFGRLIQKDAGQRTEADSEILSYFFNYAEARRRAGLDVPISDFRRIIAIYERGAATEGAGSVVLRLNHMQAMHIPYALAGDVEKARHLLQQVNDLASAVSPRERIFSVVTYTQISADQLLQQNQEMLDAINDGTLWDGSPIAAAQHPN
jgi:cellulose biosynthesis protein BcsQ